MGSIVSVITGPSRQASQPGVSGQLHRSPDTPSIYTRSAARRLLLRQLDRLGLHNVMTNRGSCCA
jgi:hypothetical protein